MVKNVTIRIYVVLVFLGGFIQAVSVRAQALIPDPAFRLRAYVNPRVYSMAIQDDGKIVVGTYLPTRGSTDPSYDSTHKAVVRLMPDGRQDTSFHPPIFQVPQTPFFTVFHVLPVENGKLLIYGSFTTQNATANGGFQKLMPDGSIDSSFHIDSLEGNYVRTLVKLSDGRYFFGGDLVIGGKSCFAAIVSQNGTLDTAFARHSAHIRSTVNYATQQPDGKLALVVSIQGGGLLQDSLLRLHPNGALDSSFRVRRQGWYATGTQLYPLPAGGFVTTGGLRLKDDGSIDTSFHLMPNAILDMALLPNGQIVTVEASNTQPYGRIVRRFNADGSQDTTAAPFFTPRPLGKILLQPDGKILTATVEYPLASDTNDGLGSVVRLTNGLTSVKKNDRCTLLVGPNPAHDVVQVQAAGRIRRLLLMDAQGRTALVLQSQANFAEVPLRNLQPGIYQILAETEKGMISARLVKE